MSEVYFSGWDLCDCLQIDPKYMNKSEKRVFNRPVKLDNVVNIEYGHFYSIYQKTNNDGTWYIKAAGLQETEIFKSQLCIKEVAVSNNLVIGLSGEGKLFKVAVTVDDADCCLELSSIKSINELDTGVKKVVSNDMCVFALISSPELSKVCKIGDSCIKYIAEFSKTRIVDFDVGNGHFVGMSDTGALWNWGHCGRSELAGCNEVSKMSVCDTPKRIEFFDDLPCVVSKIACGGWHTLALTSDGDVYSWGWNESGQLGHDTTSASKSYPYPIDLGSADDPIIDIAAGSRHSLALLKSGIVYSWGRNDEGQTGYGDFTSSFKPKLMIKTWDDSIVKIKCSKWGSFAFTTNKNNAAN